MIALPPTLCRESLAGLFAPTETHVVRVVAHGANNPTVFRFRCRSREYLFDFDPVSGRHVLDIPVSVWMHGADDRGAWAGNATIADDFRGASSPYTLEVIRIADEAPVPVVPNYLAGLRRLLSGLGAPDSVREAFALIDAQTSEAEFSAHVNAALADFECASENRAETPAKRAARRMREKRAAQKAAKLLPV